MIIGQIGIGIILKTFVKRFNLGWIIAATLLLDVVLWVFVLFGIESYYIPSNYDQFHFFAFDFPYSHGLLACICWTILTFLIIKGYTRRNKIATIMACGVFASFLLSIIIHPAEIPLFLNSHKVGIGLCKLRWWDLAFELIILLTGLIIYYQSSYSKTYTGKYGLGVFLALVIYLNFGQQFLLPDPSDFLDTALSSLTALVTIIAVMYWLDKKRSQKSHHELTKPRE